MVWTIILELGLLSLSLIALLQMDFIHIEWCRLVVRVMVHVELLRVDYVMKTYFP